MKKLLFAICFVFIGASFMITTGCKKDCTDSLLHDTTVVNHNYFDTVTNTVWTMQYNEGSSGNYMYYAAPSFIKGGTAKFASNLFHQGYWFSIYDLPIPKEISLNLDSDSLKLVANMRNVSGDGTAFEMDMGLFYAANSFASAAWQRSGSTFCLLGVTGQQINNVSEQVTDNTVYGEYGVSVQGGQVSSYKNGSVLRTTSYSGTTGNLQFIRVAFRGYGEIDWVKLYKGSKLIMIENFNVDGQTSAVWTKP